LNADKIHIVDVQLKPSIHNPAMTRARLAKTRTKSTKAAALILILTESVGTASGSIWHYLNEKGPTAVAKLVNELPEDNKTLQRSIGWLTQKGKITLDTIDRVETITLTG